MTPQWPGNREYLFPPTSETLLSSSELTPVCFAQLAIGCTNLPCNAGQYAVFTPVTQDKLTKIDHRRDNHHKGLRFMYLNHEQALIVKIPAGELHELVHREFAYMCREKAVGLGLGHELRDVGRRIFQGIASRKEPDTAFKPSSRPLESNWPTVVFECGVSESLKRLTVDSRWWLDNSAEGVKIVLLFSIAKVARSIHIEKWEMLTVQNPHATSANPHPFVTRPTKVHEVDIAGPVALAPVALAPAKHAPAAPTPAVPAPAGPAPVVTGVPLTLDLDKIFLRQPHQGEGNIILTAQDLGRYASDVWRFIQ
ncbi:hypothetical protein L873DRAFT_1746861 [Choiromyces venosus 120613-1]|uniref:Uncharacterized protein n=1 Tax=Choiromyces venosus 120613-1 TaxID=1336337 RepID=A0A3N4J8U1_9PEZI|nr:hypothetical protein L873DRAFT_1746861 [Choiromyces venosus 120613-1]